MTVSMLTGCKTAGGKKAEAPSSGNQAAAEAKTEDEEKASEGGEDYSYHWKLATTESSDYYISHFQAFQGIHQPSQLSGCKYLPCHLSACLFLHNIQEFL